MEFLIASRRGRSGDDPIFSLNAEAKRRKDAGEDVVNATIGALLDDDGRLMLMQAVVEAFESVAPELRAAYAPIPGRSDYRQAVIHDLLGAHGLVDQSVAVATPGGSGALRMAIDDFLDAGQALLTTSYFWGPYRTLADESGKRLETFNMFDASGRLDVADLDRKLGALIETQGRVLLILNTPCHNPTGYSLDAEEWAAAIEVMLKHAAKAPVVLLVDVAYAAFGADGLAAALDAIAPVTDRLLTLFAWSASKSFAQYGSRLGALVATTENGEQRRQIDNALTFSCRGLFSNCNAGGQYAIARVLSEAPLRERWSHDRNALVKMLGRRVACWNELAKGKPIVFPRYQGGFFTTVFCDDPPKAAAALRERGIFVVPTAGALRVAMCAVNEAQIARIVDGLCAVL